MAKADRRLTAARHSVDAGDSEAAVSSAYYAMLYAAHAALSERDLHAKTHGGTWSLFSQTFVVPGSLDPELGRLGPVTQHAREQADYEAEDFTVDDARSILDDAERFVAAVRAMLA